ncbi:MAG TPA: tRNA epoxyqueuosine(34) reductase QueG [Hyphomicrobiaceae bacterium]|nr:tRNA epoxyqueuosine(34) reductase QueG [Hyphomicrobiaceae bacterium]
MTSSPDQLGELVRVQAGRLGFDAVGIAAPGAIGIAGQRLRAFVGEGRHAEMVWMSDTLERRADPRRLWPECRSVIMLGMSYAPSADPLTQLQERLSEPGRGLVSFYAKGKDYHDIIKGKLKQVASGLAQASGEGVKVFVDTAPLMEKPLAEAAGIGWQGKHTNLVSRTHGSWLFLGAILTAAQLAPDAPEADHCGSCSRCLDVCPTDAFPAPYQLDPRRCIAYLTIEHKGHIAEEFRRPIGNRVFGCDDCLAVCPWNKFAADAREQRFAARSETDDPPLEELLALDDAAFRKRFAGTPVKRTGRDRIVRNALIAAGNSGNPDILPLVGERAGDDSPLVRAMAAWAAHRLAGPERFAALGTAHRLRERDPAVIAEWDQNRGLSANTPEDQSA